MGSIGTIYNVSLWVWPSVTTLYRNGGKPGPDVLKKRVLRPRQLERLAYQKGWHLPRNEHKRLVLECKGIANFDAQQDRFGYVTLPKQKFNAMRRNIRMGQMRRDPAWVKIEDIQL